jgi:xanthine dehydrogenase accessory factor
MAPIVSTARTGHHHAMTDNELRATAQDWHTAGRAAVLVEVTQALGSAPREAGTRMLVAADATLGTVGGGHLELLAIQEAQCRLAAGDGAPGERHFPLGPALGQCCGGAVTLRWQALDDHALSRWPAAPPRLCLQLYGAGHVGRAIARLLAGIDIAVDWIDERESEFPPERAPGQPWPQRIRRIAVDAVEAEVDHAPAGAAYLVLTHSHDLDMRITETILRRGDFRYLGLIGSATKRARFMHRFEQRGIAPDLLARMTCPIGLPGIEGKQPEVIAVAVAAQLLQLRADAAA